jgi:3-deoxy-D-manno-octulosonate 8-phosphate phosphatase (KDO 8-P phosphatase)
METVLIQKMSRIKLILMDVDGVLTDGGIILGSQGLEIKIFNVQDGAGITMARLAGLKVGILTGRISEAVQQRATELHFDVVSQGHFNKLTEYEQIKQKLAVNDLEVTYIGDDILDLDVLRRVGFSVAVANARPEVKSEVDYITVASGGKGAVREVIDLILKTQNRWHTIVDQMLSIKS